MRAERREGARRDEDHPENSLIVVRDHGANLAALLGAILVVVLIAAGVGSYATLKVGAIATKAEQATAETDRVADQAARVARRLDGVVSDGQLNQISSCIRSNINSAIVKLSSRRPRPDLTAEQRRLNLLLAENLYPVLDCLASQREGRNVLLAPAEMRKYVATVAGARAPIVRDGRVVGSRERLLEGVVSIDDVGRP